MINQVLRMVVFRLLAQQACESYGNIKPVSHGGTGFLYAYLLDVLMTTRFLGNFTRDDFSGY